MQTDIVNIILGMKLRQARLEAGLSLTEFAERADLSPSYVTEIEKGRKHPRANKIMRMAEILGVPYDDLVSISLEPSLTHLNAVLNAPLLYQFPFEEFGIGISDLVEVLTRAPDKASALLHALIDLARQYDVQESQFLLAALRSYQEIHENYFPDLEDAARNFAAEYGLDLTHLPLSLADMRALITERFGVQIDETALPQHPALLGFRSIFIDGPTPRLLLNPRLRPGQVKILLAREMGYQYLGLTERSYTSSPDRADSFQQVLNDFKASYFAGALFMPQQPMIDDLKHLFGQERWSPEPLLAMLSKYDVTPEVLLYRFSELVPEFFGVPLHFLRFNVTDGDYRLGKRLNMSNLSLPSNSINEHHCRRWLSVRLLNDDATAAGITSGLNGSSLRVGVQMSEFLETQARFLCLGFARPMSLRPEVDSSMIVGFRVDPDLRRIIRFADDPTIPVVTINETCERCPLDDTQCAVRAVPPTLWQRQTRETEQRQALNRLMAQMRG